MAVSAYFISSLNMVYIKIHLHILSLLTLLVGDKLKIISEYKLLVFIFPVSCKCTALLTATSTWKLFTTCNNRNRKAHNQK